MKRGLAGLVITDHDSVAAYPQVLQGAQQAGVSMVTGVEFSSQFEGASVHVLGYSFAHTAPSITALCRRHTERRHRRNHAILAKLRASGMPLDEERFIIEVGAVGRPHIAQAMVEQGYVASLPEAFKKWIGDGMPCYAAGDVITTEETIAAIHKGGGFAIIAHPHLMRPQRVITRLMTLPFDGLEGYYAHFHSKDEQRWVRMGRERDWLVTGGSDFHGAAKPMIRLGASWVNEETFQQLKVRYDSHGLP